jgi:mannosyltransferase OCH1-like enzyme
MYYYNYIIIIVLNALFFYLFSLQYFECPSTFKLESVYPAKIVSKVISKCPKVIYQIVPDINNVPSGLYHTILHNIKMNPEFEYVIYDYKTALEILKKDFSADNVNAFLSSSNNQLKTDYIKYAFISKYGGIFLDIKYICMYRFIDLLKYNNVYFVQLKRIDDMELALLASHPNNPGVENAFNKATNNLQSKSYPDTLKSITGGTVLRDELFNLGYLSDYAVANIDTDHIIRMRHTQTIICKKYSTYDVENDIFGLLPDITIDYQEKILYN